MYACQHEYVRSNLEGVPCAEGAAKPYELDRPGISKRGNIYLRKVLIHGARAAVLRIKRDRAAIGPWLDRLDARAPKNVVVVAMANKLARIAWAVLSSGQDYRPSPIVPAA